MITVKDIKLNESTKEADVSLFSDTKAEVSTNTEDYKGFPKGYKVSQGSDVMTASGDMAFMKSDGAWNWV